MYELFKVALELAAKAMTSLTGRRKDDRLQALGVELYALLAMAYEIVNRGDQIVTLLREAEPIAVAQATAPNRDSVHRWQRHLITHLRDQFEVLHEFDKQALKFGAVMDIISPGAFDSACFKMWLKARGLDRFDSMMEAATGGNAEIDLGVYRCGVRERSVRFGYIESWDWNEDIEALDEISRTTVAAIGAYLEDERPEENLASVRESLAIVHGALNEHFSVTDILLGLQARAAQPRKGLVMFGRSRNRHD